MNNKRLRESEYNLFPDGTAGILVLPLTSVKRKVFEETSSNLLSGTHMTKKLRHHREKHTSNIRQELRKLTVMPDPKKDVSPTEFLIDLVESLHGYRPEVAKALQLKDYFCDVTEERIAAYDIAAVSATRTNDINALKKLYTDGKRMDCCNRFGESLLHMACRRGFTNIGIFLLEEAKLNVRISDDCGRNPFHDICWNPRVSTDIAKLILQIDPTLLLIGDKRGHTPFDYARREDWKVWRNLLYENKGLLNAFSKSDSKILFDRDDPDKKIGNLIVG
mmetsp:Transcript_27347/g.31218  ORF Transcript_27347/g.31218 Transcript_27347/m.31218 type:complete len:277 (-) Transcript_27347:307-1137(-)